MSNNATYISSEMAGQTDDPIETLLTTYNELNSASIETLYEEPSPLEFMRYVARNTPFVVRGAASYWKACQEWNAEFLKGALKDTEVNVAVTPFGNADAPTTLLNTNLTVFAKPYEELQSFPSFLTYLQQQSSLPVPLPPSHSEIRYAQTQDNNLPHEYTLLASSVPSSIPFARIALSRLPDATNLWIGNSHSVTALHKDDYENIYVQVLGQKHFVLLPPVASPGVNERTLKGARYRRSEEGGFELALDEDGGDVPFAMWDPDVLDRNATRYSRLLRPIRVTLDPGDFLYLPAMWYHKVSQTGCAEEGICVAVNYWYDMEFSGPLYCLDTLVRSVDSRGKAEEEKNERGRVS